jgi:hypothetical protein
MTKEEILNGNVAKATQLATAAIIERAKARAAEARIAELSGQQLQRDQQKLELSNKLTEAEKRRAKAIADRSKISNKDEREAAGIEQFQTIAAVTSLNAEIGKLDAATEAANKEIQFLIGSVKAGDLTVELDKEGKGKKELDLLKQRIDALKKLQELTGLTGSQEVELVQLEIQMAQRDAVKVGFSKAELDQQITGILEKAFPVATFEFPELLITGIGAVKFEADKVAVQQAFTEGFKTDIANATGNNTIEIPAPTFVFTNLKDSVDEARRQVGEVLFNSLVRGIEESSALIGEAFAGIFSGEGVTNSLAKAAQGLLGIVGGILQDVGKQIIVTSTLVKALKAAITKLFGPGGEAIGLAVGAALIATGALLKNIKFNVPKLAEGGIATGATLGIFGEAGREAIIPLDKLPQMMGKMNLANQQPVILQPSIRFSLTEFQLGLQRVDNQRRRLG